VAHHARVSRGGGKQVRLLAEERGIKIQLDLAPAQTSGDVDRLGHVITNILSSAIHYNTPHGESCRVQRLRDRESFCIFFLQSFPEP